MNKFWKITSITAVLVAVFVFAGATVVFAQGPSQPGAPAMNQGTNETGTGLGLRSVDEATMHAAIADALGITVEAYEAEVANGENAYTLALKLGVDFAEVQAAMDAVHDAAFQQAIDDGLVSQGQAGRSRGGQSGQGAAMNRGQNNGSTGMMGRGAGNNGGGTGECIYPTP